MKKRVIILIAVILFLLIGVTIIFVKKDENPQISNGKPWVDSDLKGNVVNISETSIKDDYNLYVNRDWVLKTDIPSGESYWNMHSELEADVKRKCVDILNDNNSNDEGILLLKNYYQVNLDWKTRNELGVEPLRENVEAIVALDSLDALNQFLLDDRHIHNLFNFLSCGIEAGLEDSEHYYVYINNPDFLLNDSAEYGKMTDYGKTIYGFDKACFVFVAEKLQMSSKEAKKRFESALDFERQYASECLTAEEKLQTDFYDKINNPVKWDELTKYGNSFPLQSLLSQMGLKYENDYVMMAPNYLNRLNEVYREENLEGIKNVILVHYILDRMARLDWETYLKINDIYEKYYNIRDTEDPNEIAYEAVKSALAAELQHAYADKYLSEEDKKVATEIFEQIKDSYRNIIEDSYLGETAKSIAFDKLDKMTIKALYPDKWGSYEMPVLTGMNYVEASDAVKAYNNKKLYSRCGMKIDFDQWGDDDSFGMLDANACYYPSANAIYLCAGIWNDPVYSKNMTEEEKYANLCADLLGHEISHAFDGMGVQLDVDGVMGSWLSVEDEKRFNDDIEKAVAYLDTINPFGDYYVNGNMIITEVMADYLGMKCALNMASEIEDFDYDAFFKCYATKHKNISTYKKELSVLKRDEHPLRYLRTNVILQQFDEFYETYSIGEGDGMYLSPEKRFSFYKRK